MTVMRIGIIGCGNIATGYITDLKTYPALSVVGVTDVDLARAQAFAAEHDVRAYDSVEAMLADLDIDLVVDLTPAPIHQQINEQALKAGKHVYSEKPLALTPEDAQALVALAKERGLRLGCSPFTFIGEAQQTAWKLIRDGRLGQVRVIYAEANWGRIESWHPAPVPFYQVGALTDVGVYLLAILTAICGPARTVQSFGKMVMPDRQTKDGVPYHLTTPDYMLTLLEMADGTLVRLTADFYVSNQTSRQTGIEFHGDLGSVFLESFLVFDSPVMFAPFGEEFQPVPLIRPGYEGIPWGRGVNEMAEALAEGRPHRFSGEHAAHVTDILTAAHRSMQTGEKITLSSTFPPPPPADWAV